MATQKTRDWHSKAIQAKYLALADEFTAFCNNRLLSMKGNADPSIRNLWFQEFILGKIATLSVFYNELNHAVFEDPSKPKPTLAEVPSAPRNTN